MIITDKQRIEHNHVNVKYIQVQKAFFILFTNVFARYQSVSESPEYVTILHSP